MKRSTSTTLGSRGFLACLDACAAGDPPAGAGPGPAPGTAEPGAQRSSFWLAERAGFSCQRPTTAPLLPLARLLAPPSSSSSGGAGTCREQ
jgi:hypothetical protein